MAISQVETLVGSTVKTISVASPAGASFNLQEEGVNIYVEEIYTVHNRFLAVEVVNIDGTAAVYFTVDGTTPTVEGDNTIALAAVAGDSALVPTGATESITVKAISSGTPTISVRGS